MTDTSMIAGRSPDGTPRRELGQLDCVAIIVGIIVGAGIFETAPSIAGLVSHPGIVFLVWALGGILSVLGALCYAELATTYPREGGDYVYLNRAYGRWAGFLFAWARLSIIQTGSIGLMAYVFARYATDRIALGPNSYFIYALAAVVTITALNLLGTRQGKWTQIVLTSAKVIGLSGLVFISFLFTPSSPVQREASRGNWGGFSLAMIFVLWTYGGWNEAAYVAAEVRDPKRNIVRSLLIGTLLVTGLYLIVNAAYLYALGPVRLSKTQAVATDVVAGAFPGAAGAVRNIMGLLVMISALGAINGETFTGARISYAMGREHPLFGFLGRWNTRTNGPTWALLTQGSITAGLIWLAGRWGGEEGFNTLLKFTAPVFWLFFLLTALSLLVLRWRDAAVERPFRVPVYPIIPVVFCLCCGFMLHGSISYAMTIKAAESVPSLPGDFAFPDHLLPSLGYDRQSRTLSFEGVMSAATRNELLALHDADDFREAVAAIYARSQEQRWAAILAFGIPLIGLALYWISCKIMPAEPVSA